MIVLSRALQTTQFLFQQHHNQYKKMFHTILTFLILHTILLKWLELSSIHHKTQALVKLKRIPSHETNLSSFATREEVDHVDKYIDWRKVEEMNIELDPVEILETLGFGVNP